MRHSHEKLIEQARRMAAPLNSQERLALIQAIASLETSQNELVSEDPRQGQVLDAEQKAWFGRPAEERHRYRGQFVAVRDGQVIDQDPNQRALYIRVRANYKSQQVLIIPADWHAVPQYTIHNPNLER